MVTITWQGGDGVNTLGIDQYCGFFGSGAFGTSIPTGEYQENTFVTDVSGGVNYGELPNVKYIGVNTADWGDGVESIANILSSECTLRITLSSGSAFRLQAINFFVYTGDDETVAPPNVTVKAFEYGDTSWQTLSGSAQPLNLTPQLSASTAHTFYIAVSVTPLVTGTNAQMKFGFYAEYY